MGLILEGKWTDNEPEELKRNSKNIRFSGGFNNSISKNDLNFKPDFGRYLLYVNHTCPWSHLVIIARLLKNLESSIGIIYLDSVMGPRSWRFSEKAPDPEINANHLYELYIHSNNKYTGRVTIPILWDTLGKTIVNNNSSDILHMFESGFSQADKQNSYSLYSTKRRSQEKKLDEFVSTRINDGIYQCLLSETPPKKKVAERNFTKAMYKLDSILKDQKYLVGNIPTVPDWKFFVTLVRFDLVYSKLFLTNGYLLEDFKNIPSYLKRLLNYDQISRTINFHEMVRGYYRTLGKTENFEEIINFMDGMN
ncbi:MAG: hypothetical protein VXY22_01320 [Pseudomonadota bacterium]|nr:hypothetical protein [Pseudomonadota bacterium]